MLLVTTKPWATSRSAEERFSELYAAMKSTLARAGATAKAPKWFEIVDIGAGIVQEIGNGTDQRRGGHETGPRSIPRHLRAVRAAGRVAQNDDA